MNLKTSEKKKVEHLPLIIFFASKNLLLKSIILLLHLSDHICYLAAHPLIYIFFLFSAL